MKRMQASLLAVAALFGASSTIAQQADVPVQVDLRAVAGTIAKKLKVDAAKVPATLPVPAAIAADACGVPALHLAPRGIGEKISCAAKVTTPALEQFVLKQATAKT